MASRAASRGRSVGDVEALVLVGAAPEHRVSIWGAGGDGRTLYFDSTRTGLGGHDLWQATRADVGAAFGNPEPLSGLNTAADEYNVSLSRDELELVFTSNRDGSSTYRLYRSLRSCP